MSKRYTDTFKQEAIHYAVSHPEKSPKEIAQEIDVPYRTLGVWLRGVDRNASMRRPSAPNQTIKALEQENKRLAREVSIQKTELELLKKFNVYLAKNQG
jgi:transposase-like protein